ncbi:Rieske (2Fe-2S) protein [Burkholderia sp. USMB20]|uniref:Rieske (2Fe-2S) protein n=1 Tax=Burkholderia sp. USMB20 TaxID=1571773 RepID=UPI0005CE98DC|nr:Rieske 2Fe-2S domain-containing protein [Burkholderia sp. USMB20]TGN98681.1 (2Fe-2S)-binding protein [Burkholderia sp. USMB20]
MNAGGWVRLCAVGDIPVVGARGFDLRGSGADDVFLVRMHDAVHGYRNSCPHWPGATLPWRKDAYLDATGSAIVCHGHGARFDIATGRCITGPCIGRQLTAIPVKITRDDSVWALLPEYAGNGRDRESLQVLGPVK